MANYQICQILNMNVTGRSNNIATLELVNFIENSQLGTAINTEVPLEFHDALLVCHQTRRCALSPSFQLDVTYFRYVHCTSSLAQWPLLCSNVKQWSVGQRCGHGDTRRGGITYLRYLDSCVSLSRLLWCRGQVWPGRHGGGGGGDGAQIGGATSGYKWPS